MIGRIEDMDTHTKVRFIDDDYARFEWDELEVVPFEQLGMESLSVGDVISVADSSLAAKIMDITDDNIYMTIRWDSNANNPNRIAFTKSRFFELFMKNEWKTRKPKTKVTKETILSMLPPKTIVLWFNDDEFKLTNDDIKVGESYFNIREQEKMFLVVGMDGYLVFSNCSKESFDNQIDTSRAMCTVVARDRFSGMFIKKLPENFKAIEKTRLDQMLKKHDIVFTD